MRASLLTLLGAAASAQATDYFFRFIGGNDVTNNERLRLNNSIPYFSPGVTAAPHDPADHFSRIYVNETGPATGVFLYVVPTNPHPPPVPGYYALSGADGVPDAYRLVQTYGPDAPGTSFYYRDWDLVSSDNGKVLLRYGGDPYSERRWIAVRETSTTGVDRWVPWWVRPTAGNMANLTTWDYEIADLELVVATGNVNSGAPGGVEE